MCDTFENIHIRDEKQTKSLYRWYCYRRKLMRTLHILLAVIGALSIVFLFILDPWEQYVTWLSLIVLFEVTHYLRYRKTIKLALQREAEVNAGRLAQYRLVIHDDRIRMEDAAGQGHDVPITNMKWAQQTKDFVIICSKTKYFYVFPNDTFTQGSPDALIAYLRAKGIGK